MNKKQIIAQKSKKLSSLLADCGFSYGQFNKLLRKGDIKINGKPAKEDVTVDAGTQLTVFYADDILKKKYETIYQTENVLIVYKYAGIETEGENGLEGVLSATAVHRLDRNTEGLMVFAKNKTSENILKKAFKNHQISKFYVAEVLGCFDVDKTYKAYLVKDSENSFVKIFDKKVPSSTEIVTKIKTIKAGVETSLVQVELVTGKTHQIRAHLAHLGHAIVGDGKYGKNENNKKFKQKRQKLACFMFKFEYLGLEDVDFKEFRMLPKWLKIDIK